MRCHATKRDGSQCGMHAMKGCTVCRMHGGMTPNVRARGLQRVEEAKAVTVLRRHHVEPITNPVAELMRVVSEVVTLKDLLAARVDDLSAAGASEVAMYARLLEQAGRLLTDVTRLGIERQLSSITERDAEMIVQVVTAALEDVGVTGQQLEAIRPALALRFEQARARRTG